MRTTFTIKTFGCQMNKHDSERLAGLLVDKGYSRTDNLDEAGIIIYNTCCVRRHADDRLYGNVAALKQLKKDRPDLIIAVGGCLAQRDGRRLRERLPHVDIVFGTHNQGDLPRFIADVGRGKTVCDLSTDGTDIISAAPARYHERHAWVPITTGCDNYCTYCIVPYVRGREESRPRAEISAEIEELVGQGVIEVTLLGQNVNSYGRDLYGKPGFASLLKQTAAIAGLRRIRFTTSHPKDLTDDIIKVVAERENICKHFHLPVQAGADRILKAMRRRYTRDDYLNLAAKIKARIPGVSLTTDVMVGFPGETEADFADTLDLMAKVRFDQAFTFIYSPRKGTKAAEFPDQVPEAVKKERFQRLVDLQNSICRANNEALTGREFEVYVEGFSKKGKYNLVGRSDQNKLVHFKGESGLLDKFVTVRIIEAYSWFLIGELRRS